MHHRRIVLPLLAVVALAVGMLGAAPVLAGGRPFTTTLSGPSEVPAGDPDATGTATVWINPGQGTVCFSWSVRNADPIGAAHIHRGVAGVAGPVVVPLLPAAPTNSATGCTTGVDRSLAIDIIRHPWNYYVNTHNGAFPTGVARGQLSRTP
jgi:hypothetical protein